MRGDPPPVAFAALRAAPVGPTALYYVALPPDQARELRVDGPEAQPTATIAIGPFLDCKIAALEAHASQTDAREMTAQVRREHRTAEYYHRAYPPLASGERDMALHDLPQL